MASSDCSPSGVTRDSAPEFVLPNHSSFWNDNNRNANVSVTVIDASDASGMPAGYRSGNGEHALNVSSSVSSSSSSAQPQPCQCQSFRNRISDPLNIYVFLLCSNFIAAVFAWAIEFTPSIFSISAPWNPALPPFTYKFGYLSICITAPASASGESSNCGFAVQESQLSPAFSSSQTQSQFLSGTRLSLAWMVFQSTAFMFTVVVRTARARLMHWILLVVFLVSFLLSILSLAIFVSAASPSISSVTVSSVTLLWGGAIQIVLIIFVTAPSFALFLWSMCGGPSLMNIRVEERYPCLGCFLTGFDYLCLFLSIFAR